MERQEVLTIYDTAFRSYITQYEQLYKGIFLDYSVPDATDDLETLFKNRDYLKERITVMESVDVQPCMYDARAQLVSFLNNRNEELNNTIEKMKHDKEKELEATRIEHEQALKQAEINASNSVKDLVDLHKELLQYKHLLSATFERYDIVPSDVAVSRGISRGEMSRLLMDSVKVCKTFNQTTNKSLLRKLNLSTEGLSNQDLALRLIGLLLGAIALSPILLIGYMKCLFTSTNNLYMNIEKLKIANSLMYIPDFNNYIDEDAYKVEELDTSEIERKYETMLMATEDLNGAMELIDEVIAIKNPIMIQECNNANDAAKTRQRETIGILKECLDGVEKSIEYTKSILKPLGTYQQQSVVMRRKIVTSRLFGEIDAEIEFPMCNVIFEEAYGRNEMLDYMKLFYCNTLLGVKEKHLYTYVCDDIRLGTAFSEFLDKSIEDYVSIDSRDSGQILEEVKIEIEERVKVLKTDDIDTHNKACEEVGKVPIDYKLYIFIGDSERLIKDTLFATLLTYSYKYGITIWFLGPKLDIDDVRYFSQPAYGDGEKIVYSMELGSTTLETYIDAFEHSKDKGLDYKTGYQEKYLPRDKWWTYNTIKGIDLRFGLVDGDPEKPYHITLGDAPVHGLMIGATGAGKSVTINDVVANLIIMYPPTELSLVMVDFKNIEFSFYSDPETHTFSRLPHARVLAGTTDGEYAVSIFKYLYDEMLKRTAVFREHNVKKLEELRLKCPDIVMPRILILIDEFQVMFQEVPPKVLSVIMERIRSLAKLARFCGAHMLFCSQSMKGTMDKDVLDQYSLRVALRCAEDVANQIFGCNKPSQIKSKVGYLYTNDMAGTDRRADLYWRAPYAPNEDLEEIIAEINKMYGKKITTEFYDEKYPYYQKDLLNWYKQHGDKFADVHTFILGEQTGFSVNKAPNYLEFVLEDGDNVLIAGERKEDVLNVVLTLVTNIKQKEGCKILIHTADTDTFDIIDIPSIVGGELAEVSNADQSLEELMDSWEYLIESRKSVDKSILTPIYIFCLYYDKQKGIGRNSNTKVLNRFQAILQDGPNYDVHFIVSIRTRGELMTSNFKVYNHKILCKVDATLSSQLIETDTPSKFPALKEDGLFCLYKHLTDDPVKFKIYQHEFAKEITTKQIFIE